MGQPIKNIEAESLLRKQLEQSVHWHVLNRPLTNGQNGVDIIAKHNDILYLIEVIGYKKSPPARSRDFYEIFWRAISRIEGAKEECKAHECGTFRLVLALPAGFKRGMQQRQSHYRTAWSRIARAFPELEIWYITSDGFLKHQWQNPY